MIERIQWTVTDAGDRISERTDVLLVRRVGAERWETVHVWRSQDTTLSFACCECAGPRVAMRADCVHCKAAKRAHLKKMIKPKEKA